MRYHNKQSAVRIWGTRILQWSIIILCLVYAFWDLDADLFIKTVSGYNAFAVLVAAASTLGSYIALSGRLGALSEGELGLVRSLVGTIIGQGLNNILPAKLGEAVKAIYLARESGRSKAWFFGLVFWERFFDLNALLFLGILIVVFSSSPASMGAYFLGVIGIWVTLMAIRQWPNIAQRLVRKVPFTTVRLFFLELVQSLIRGLTLKVIVRVAVWTLIIWFFYVGQVAVILLWAAEIELSVPAVLVIFVVAGIGMNLAASPGGLGVYEAAIVVSASWFGVSREEALASAIVLHALQFIPSTVLGLVLASRVNISFKQAKNTV